MRYADKWGNNGAEILPAMNDLSAAVIGFAVCLALVLLMLPVVVRSTQEMLKPAGGTCVLR